MQIDREEFLRYYERVRERTLRVVACIPREQFEWSYQPGKFSFADLLRHLAGIERYMFAENARLRASRYPGHGAGLADGWDSVMAYFDRCHRESMEIFGALSAEDLGRACITPRGTPIAVWKWLRAMVEHEIHHRGQLYLYLAILGVPTPPLYGMTSEEVREASGFG
jgi:uncharacterized damage-inducible protein DinB